MGLDGERNKEWTQKKTIFICFKRPINTTVGCIFGYKLNNCCNFSFQLELSLTLGFLFLCRNTLFWPTHLFAMRRIPFYEVVRLHLCTKILKRIFRMVCFCAWNMHSIPNIILIKTHKNQWKEFNDLIEILFYCRTAHRVALSAAVHWIIIISYLKRINWKCAEFTWAGCILILIFIHFLVFCCAFFSLCRCHLISIIFQWFISIGFLLC